MILTQPSALHPFKMTWPWALLFCSISLVAGRQGHLPHNVKCTGWEKVCSQLTGVIAGPARVGTAVVIDCVNAFYKEGIDGREVKWTVEKWGLPNNHTEHYIDEAGKLHLVNLTESDTGIYQCHLLATIDDDADNNNNFPDSLAKNATHAALITWPLKVYTMTSDALHVLVIWVANGVLVVVFVCLVFINEKSAKGRFPLVVRPDRPAKDNRVPTTRPPTQTTNSTKYGTLDTTQ